ncbi:MAG: ABC transporter permease subunit [bacterium]
MPYTSYKTYTLIKMKRIIALSKITFLEGVRGKIFYNLLIFGILMACSSTVLSMLSIGDKAKIVKDVCLLAISILGIGMIIVLGILTMHNDLDKGLVHNLISKPLSKAEYLLGKFLGIGGLVLINTIIITIVMSLLVWIYKGGFTWVLYYSILLIFIELMILNAMVILFSTFVNPNLAFLGILALYVIGHSTTEAKQLIVKRADFITRHVFSIICYILPNFDYLDIKIQAVHDLKVTLYQLFYSSLYGVSYTCVLLFLAVWIMKKKDI